MAKESRPVGRCGTLPAQIPAALKDLTYYAAGPLPQAPAKVAAPNLSWGMDGNDTYGDCGVAGVNHGFMTAAAETGRKEVFPSASDIISYYLTYTGGQDSGVVLSQFLGYVKTKGFFGHTVEAYAPINYLDTATLHFAINAYNFAYSGIAVTAQMQQDYADGQPWTLESLESEVVGGHCIPLVGYDSDYLYAVTWGAIQPIAYSAWSYMASESWAVLTGEVKAAGTDGHGINYSALQADLDKLDA